MKLRAVNDFTIVRWYFCRFPAAETRTHHYLRFKTPIYPNPSPILN
jgi:hypothetical protein